VISVERKRAVADAPGGLELRVPVAEHAAKHAHDGVQHVVIAVPPLSPDLAGSISRPTTAPGTLVEAAQHAELERPEVDAPIA
jgi:hypothetical protein